jgi:WD40 repeat protein
MGVQGVSTMTTRAGRILGRPFGCLLIGLVLSQAVVAAPDAATIEKLIQQLGDDDFEKRQEASQKLAEVGEPALGSSRKAAKEQTDAEVRERAKDLVKRIEKDLRGELLIFGAGGGYWLNRVAFTPDGKQAVVTGGGVILFDLETGKEINRSLELSFARPGLALSRDGKQFVTGHQYDHLVRIGEVKTGKVIQVFEGHRDGVYGVAFSPDGNRVLSGSLDKTLRLWDVKTGKMIKQFPGIEDKVRSVDYSPDGRRVVSGHWGEKSTFLVRLWDVETGKEIRSFKGHSREVSAVLFLPRGRLLSTGMEGNVIVWDAETGKAVLDMTHTGGVNGAAVSPDGKRALTAGFGDRKVRLWDLTTGKEVKFFEGHEGAVLGVAFSADGKRALSSDSQCRVRLWRLP